MSGPRRIAVAGAAALAAAALGPAPAQADPVADFYKGRTVTYLTPGGSRGTYGFFATLVQRHLGKHIPGNPTVIPQFVTGAGGIKGVNFAYNAAPKDGSLVGGSFAGIAHTQVLGARSVKYDASKLNWLGAWSTVYNTLTLLRTAPAITLEGAKRTEVVLGTTGLGSNSYQYPALLNDMLGTRFKLVSGYKGGGSIRFAMEKGEVHGWAGFYSQYPSAKPEWVRDNTIVHLVQFVMKKHPDLPNVPSLVDLARNDMERKVFEFVSLNGPLARAYFAPPGVPADRVAALRAAFAGMLRDPAFLSDAKRRRLPITPYTAAEIRGIVAKIVGAPRDVVARAKQAMGIK